MHCTKKITKDLYYVGVNDRRLELFENLFPIEKGVSYNSYVLTDNKTVLLDAVDSSASKQFIENVLHVLEGRPLDYLIVNHMEPDHAASIGDIIKLYPEVKIVGNIKTFTMMKQFSTLPVNEYLVKEGDILDTGTHKLTFIAAPMVHWPEVMVTYDKTDKILFSADAFGTFGALDGRLFADEYNFDRDWLDDARRYFTNIVGKYGAQVVTLLNKTAALEINMICPLHGPLWRDNLSYFIEKHMHWSTYQPEDPNEIVLAYASMYGNTECVVNSAAMKISESGKKVHIINVCNTDKSFLISEFFRVGTIILACPTYNGGIYPAMESLILDMKSLNLQNRKVFLIENGTWAPTAGKKMSEILTTMKNMTIGDTLSIKSALHSESALDSFVSKIISNPC